VIDKTPTDHDNRAASVNPSITPKIGDGNKIYFMYVLLLRPPITAHSLTTFRFYFWGYTSAFVVYALLSHFFPAPETHIPAVIYDDGDIISGEEKADSDVPEKGIEPKVSPV